MSEDRSKFIGGSDIAAILGISPFKTALEVYREKVEGAEEYDSPRLRRGKRMEPVIIEMLQEERDVWVWERNVRAHHPDHHFLSCQIDYTYAIEKFLPVTLGNGEVKSIDPRGAQDWGEDGTQEVPAYYAAQIMYGMAITGAPEATLTALIGDDLRCYVFKRDEDLCGALIQQAVYFWMQNVQTQVPPPPQTPEDAAYLVRRFQGSGFEASDALRDAVQDLRDAKANVKAAKALEDKAQMRVLEWLTTSVVANGIMSSEKGADAERIAALYDGKPLLTWNLQKRAGYVVAPCEFRVLRLGKER